MEGQGGYPRGYFNPHLPYQNVQMYFNTDTNQLAFTQGNNSPTVSSQTSSIDSSSASDSPTSTNQPSCSKRSSTSPDVEPSKGKKTYDKFSEEQQKALVNLWAEKYDELDSKDNRKVWDDIAQKLKHQVQAQESNR